MIQRLRPTWLEIDLDAVRENARFLREKAGDARLTAVVKADGYGHGAVPVARAALEGGATALAVALVEEGVALREGGIDAPVLVLGGISEAGADAVARHGLAQAVFDTRTVGWLAAAAAKAERPVDVHIKIDSGMSRIGVRDEAALLDVANAVLAAPGLRLAGVFTHFATADTEDEAFVRTQHARFLPLVEALRSVRPDVTVHAANSAATLRYPDTHHDMVRTGIALYVPPGPRHAMRWLTRAVQVKTIAPGETVSYGRIFTAERPTRVMSLPVGYADGYHRAIGGVGQALVRGMRAPVIGRVCMDQTLLDVTDIPSAAVDDEVVLLGAQGEDRITAREMGDWCGMIDYEIVLSPTARVPRVYVDRRA